MTRDEEAAQAVLRVLKSYAQYTYTLSEGDALKIVRTVDSVRRK
jgi:hypothetical protein